MSGGAPGSGAEKPRRRGTPAATAAAKSVALPQPGAAAPDGEGAWQGPRPGWVLLGSGLGPAARASLRQLAALSGAAAVDKWAPGVTHVVCGSAPNGTAR